MLLQRGAHMATEHAQHTTMAHIHLLSLIFYPPYDVGAMVTSLVAGAPLWPTCGIPPPPHCWGLPCRPDGCAPHTGAPAALGPPHGPPRDKKTAAAPRGHVGVTLGGTLRARRRHPGGYKGPQQHLEGILGVKRTTAAPRGHVGVTLGGIKDHSSTPRACRRHSGGYKEPQQHPKGMPASH